MSAPPASGRESEQQVVVEKKPRVLDLTHLEQEVLGVQDCFADEIEAIDARFQVAYEDLPEIKQREEDGKMVELVSLYYIHALMEVPPRTAPLRDCSAESIGRMWYSEEQIKDIQASFQAMQTARDIKNDIIRQYRQQGYAYVELDDN